MKTTVTRVPLRLANSHLVRGKKTIIVDTGDPGFSHGLYRAMQREGINRSDISLIFITHGHIDHYGSVFALKKALDVPVAVHRLDQIYLEKGTQAPLYPLNRPAALLKRVGQGMRVRHNNFKADIIVDDHLDLLRFGVEGFILPTPGHTLGSASLILPDSCAITGDLIIRRHFFRGPAEACVFLHDKEKYHNSVNLLKLCGVKKIYPGHGASIDMEPVYAREERIRRRSTQTKYDQR
ncbi:MAG: MBL fold metallo-hydrolase [Syntrophomonadaceae bacterium]|nr:MBL fold metallo-hydrolase [Syntrophomonadaceae bacterium]